MDAEIVRPRSEQDAKTQRVTSALGEVDIYGRVAPQTFEMTPAPDNPRRPGDDDDNIAYPVYGR